MKRTIPTGRDTFPGPRICWNFSRVQSDGVFKNFCIYNERYIVSLAKAVRKLGIADLDIKLSSRSMSDPASASVSGIIPSIVIPLSSS